MTLDGTLEAAETDEGVRFTFTVTNAGDDAIELSFRDAQTHDIVVREDGNERWRWSDGRMFVQVLTSEELDPDESVEYEGTWSTPSSGSYAAVAELEATDHDCTAETEFSL